MDVVKVVSVGDGVDSRVCVGIDVPVEDAVVGLGKEDVVVTVGVDGTSVGEGV